MKDIRESTSIMEKDIIINLNDILEENDMEEKFSFSFCNDGDSFMIKLHETYEFGYGIELYRSEEVFDTDLEKNYESGDLKLQDAIMIQIKRNFDKIINELNELKNPLEGRII